MVSLYVQRIACSFSLQGKSSLHNFSTDIQVCVTSPHRPRKLCRTQSLHPPRYPVTLLGSRQKYNTVYNYILPGGLRQNNKIDCHYYYYYYYYYWRKGEVRTRFWWGNLRERNHWGDQDVDGRIKLRWIFRKWERVVGTGWSWLRIGTDGGRL